MVQLIYSQRLAFYFCWLHLVFKFLKLWRSSWWTKRLSIKVLLVVFQAGVTTRCQCLRHETHVMNTVLLRSLTRTPCKPTVKVINSDYSSTLTSPNPRLYCIAENTLYTLYMYRWISQNLSNQAWIIFPPEVPDKNYNENWYINHMYIWLYYIFNISVVWE